jgi:PAS domain S-box-containing protein
MSDTPSQERDAATAAVRLSEQRFRSLVSATAQIVWTTDSDGRFVDEQPDWGAFTGQTFEEYRGDGWLAVIHPDDRVRTAEAWSRAVESRRPYEVINRLRRFDGVYRDFSVRGVPVREEDGSVREWVGIHTDITKQQQAEKEREFLIQASEILASSLDYEQTLARVARLVVEQLADWCAIDIVEDGAMRRVATARGDEAGEGVDFEAMARNQEILALLCGGDPPTAMKLPLVTRGSEVGAITLIATRSGSCYDGQERELVEDLARRAAVAVDHARLFRETASQAAALRMQLDELQSQAGQLEKAHEEMRVANEHLHEANTALTIEIGDRTHAQEQFREAALSYRSLWDSLTDLVYILDLDGHVLTVNDAVVARYGYRPEEVLGSTPAILAAPGLVDLDQMFTAIRRAVDGETQRFEFWAQTKDGEIFPKEVVLNRGEYFGAPVVIAVARDITKRKEAEVAIRESEERFRQLAEGVNEVFWLYDFATQQTIYVNPRFHVIWGRTLEELYEEPGGWASTLHPADRDRVVAQMELRRGQEYEMEYRIVRPDGEVRWIRDRGYPIRDALGRVYRTAGVAEDITEQKRVEAERAAAEAHYRRLVMRAPHAIFVIDAKGYLTEVNPAGAEIMDLLPTELLGRHFSEVLAPEDVENGRATVAELMAGMIDHVEVELSAARPSGERRTLALILTGIVEDGAVIGIHGTARDITEERARQEEVRLLASALECLEEGVTISRFDGQILYANSRHAKLLGYDREAGGLPNAAEFIPDEAERRTMEEMYRTVAELGTWTGRVRRRARDGRVIRMELIVSRVDRENKDSVVFNISRDIGTEILKEQQLRRVERLASVGTLIGGVAHELNNPLHAIRNFAELLLMEERGSEDQEALDIIKREADRAAKIVSDLRLIARETQEGDGAREAVDLNDIVHHVLKVRRYSLETGNVVVQEEFSPDLPSVLANRGEIEQVVMNLAVNAEQAMAGQKRERRLVVRTRATSGGASVHVIDTGPGIPHWQLERIFDPFFTTKAPGEGTGLGLSLVHGIVAEHGGEIHVDSKVGKGTEFRVDLPRAPFAAPAPVAEHVPPPTARSLSVLVVDDEDSVRRVSARYLRRMGHEVDSAMDGGEALRLLDNRHYDVILSDLRMPGLSGEDLFHHLRDRGGGLERRLIFMTGDAASEQAARMLAAAEVPVLIKPVSLEALSRAIERVANSTVHAGEE